MARFVAGPDLERKALELVTPQLLQVADRVVAEAKRLAPPTKAWISLRDGRVRDTHVEADQKQTDIPGNLRFKVTSMQWDIDNRGLGPHTWMQEPRDESSRAVANILNCRCKRVDDPEGIRKLISRSQPISGARTVTSVVVCEGHLVVQAEFGDRYDLGLAADGAHFMSGAAAVVAAELRARR